MSDNRIPARLKKMVAERAGNRCEYCLSPLEFSIDPFVTEHILPKSRGGKSTLDNLAFACQGCNGQKYNKTEAEDPVTGELVPLYHPRQDDWKKHFTWSEGYTILIGLTNIGRATIAELDLNRLGVINFRRVLLLLNEHPSKQP
ncbi:MAG: HNH endonuclease [Anaerolineales bacterium]|nr:HNH endonuclease [Anaerolineales bacterium]